MTKSFKEKIWDFYAIAREDPHYIDVVHICLIFVLISPALFSLLQDFFKREDWYVVLFGAAVSSIKFLAIIFFAFLTAFILARIICGIRMSRKK